MNKTLANVLLGVALIAAACFVTIAVFAPSRNGSLGGTVSVGNYDTTSNLFTEATTTINTTSTQLASSILKVLTVENTSNATITCSLDGQGTTAASSTVAANRGVVIAPTSTANFAPQASFGECYPGATNCYRHKGAVNCLASSAVTVTTLSQN